MEEIRSHGKWNWGRDLPLVRVIVVILFSFIDIRQVLDLARLSLEDPENEEETAAEKYQILLSDIYLSLGDVAIESGMKSGFSPFIKHSSPAILSILLLRT